MHIARELILKLTKARHVAILTGAGVSAESGIKTFRDPDGLWTKLNPAELSSIDGFLSNPERVWEWYSQRKEIITNAKPNAGHFAVAEMEKLFPRFTLITQNVDRLHQRAGSTNVIELHGNLEEDHCQNCKRPFHGVTNLPDGRLPKCSHCGGFIRPSVIWFGEILPIQEIRDAETASLTCDVFFSIGTSAEVYPAANLPVQAKLAGAFLVEVNPNLTVLSPYADIRIAEKFSVAMPALINALKKTQG